MEGRTKFRGQILLSFSFAFVANVEIFTIFFFFFWFFCFSKNNFFVMENKESIGIFKDILVFNMESSILN